MESIKINRSGLKGGLATRRGGKVYDQYDEIKKDCCGKMFGEKCECNNTKKGGVK